MSSSRARPASSWSTRPRPTRIEQMQLGKVDAIIVVPKGYGAGARRERRGAGATLPGHGLHGPDRGRSWPVRSTRSSGACSASSTSAASRRSSSRARRRSRPRTSTSSATSCRACSACRSCRSASSPRSRSSPIARSCILKRLAATPLRRWQLVGSNVLMRLLIALAQTVIIVGGRDARLRRRDRRQPVADRRRSWSWARWRSWRSATSSRRSPRPRTRPTG